MEAFFELLQVAIGSRECLSASPTKREWQQLMDMAVKQSLTGIAFSAIERLTKEQWPPKELVFQWVGIVNAIEQQNRRADNVCVYLYGLLRDDGFKCCVLKGQANHAYYPEELGDRRICGDIDVWVVPEKDVRHPVRQTLEYLKRKYGLTGLCYLHASIPDVDGVPVEVHFRPSFMNAPIKSKRFLKLFNDFDECVCQKEIGKGIVIPALKPQYDVIFQMLHIYRHLIDEGVGLRQVLDYFFMLKSFTPNPSLKDERSKYMKTIEHLGMDHFARALMYVLGEVFAMPREYMLCEPSEKDGRFLLNEILIAGNFGHDDPRMAVLNSNGYLSYRTSQAGRRFKRNMRFFSSYPEEVCWEPITRVAHFAWKKLKLWRC